MSLHRRNTTIGKHRKPSRRGFMKIIALPTAFAAVAAVASPHKAAKADVSLVGGVGLRPNAWGLVNYIRANYPGVQSIGGVRPDRLPDHPSGRAIDIMVGGNTALGNMIHADIMSKRSSFGIQYTLWQVANHYDHIHVTVF